MRSERVQADAMKRHTSTNPSLFLCAQFIAIDTLFSMFLYYIYHNLSYLNFACLTFSDSSTMLGTSCLPTLVLDCNSRSLTLFVSCTLEQMLLVLVLGGLQGALFCSCKKHQSALVLLQPKTKVSTSHMLIKSRPSMLASTRHQIWDFVTIIVFGTKFIG